MIKNRKHKGDVCYYLHSSKRKTPIAYSTAAISDMLTLIHQDFPLMTIKDIYNYITDETKCVLFLEAIAVCRSYIDRGESEIIPRWK